MRIASIDIGTNTCNLSIAEYSETSAIIKFILKEKKVIALIDPKFKNDTVHPESISRLIEVLKEYKKTIETYNVDKIIATATSGVRSSINKNHIVETIKYVAEIKVSVIDGHSEARYVYEGVNNAVELTNDYVLIIDIGGGSIEFIICNKNGIFSTYSFDIGAARLLHKQQFSDPLSNDDINTLNNILDENLRSLIEKGNELQIDTLIGSSGSFETFVDLINQDIIIRNFDDSETYNILELNKFEEIYKKLISFNYSERLEMPGMESMRVKMIPIAAVITKFLINKLSIKKLIQSRYSIKEGLIFDYISKNF